MIDNQLIKKFRKKVNSNNYFTLFKYRNINEKNQWNLICACMDWIDVSIEYITNHKSNSRDINIQSMELYTLISSIDIIWESIQQLHRVIVNVKTIPFKGDKCIFSNNFLEDDNDYFKHIRAAFGAHPVNLAVKEGRWFASWPTNTVYTEFDFAVRLYTSDVNKEDITFGIHFNELKKYLVSRYNYLDDLIDELEIQYNNFCKEKSKNKIIFSGNNIENLFLLKKEAKKRLNNSYYIETIDELLTIFNSDISIEKNRKLISKYHHMLKETIEEIRINLENMTLKDISYLDDRFPDEIHYELSKFFDKGKEDYLYDYHVKKISDFLKDYILITTEISFEEAKTTVLMGLNEYWENNL